MKEIFTIQHTQSVHHTNGMVGSWTDWPLSDLGRIQAENIGKKIRKEIQDKPFIMYSSDLLRAKQTAEIIGKHLNITPIFRTALRERNLGKCVGKSVKWLKENLECQEKTIDDKVFSDAESRREVWNRLYPFFRTIMTDEHKNIILVSHGDTLSIFYSMWLGLDVESLNHIQLFGSAGGVSYMYENDESKKVIKKMCDLSYILE